MGLSIFYKYTLMKFYEYEYGYSPNIYEWSWIYPQEYSYEYRGFFVDNILSRYIRALETWNLSNNIWRLRKSSSLSISRLRDREGDWQHSFKGRAIEQRISKPWVISISTLLLKESSTKTKVEMDHKIVIYPKVSSRKDLKHVS